MWSPDGRRLAFGGSTVSWIAADGTGAAELLTRSDREAWHPNAFSPDGHTLVLEDFRFGLGALSLDGDGTASRLWESMYWERNADLSPDGRWLAYESNEAGRFPWEVWVRPFPNVEDFQVQVSDGGGSWPLWNPSSEGGYELFYVGPDGMMSVQLQTEPEFRYSTPVPLFDTAGYGTSATVGTNRRIDVASDGSRFLMFKLDAAFMEARQPVLLQNWADELQRLVPSP